MAEAGSNEADSSDGESKEEGGHRDLKRPTPPLSLSRSSWANATRESICECCEGVGDSGCRSNWKARQLRFSLGSARETPESEEGDKAGDAAASLSAAMTEANADEEEGKEEEEDEEEEEEEDRERAANDVNEAELVSRPTPPSGLKGERES